MVKPSEIEGKLCILTDDCDQNSMEMRVSIGGNGDVYVSIGQTSERWHKNYVRLATSGGNITKHRDLVVVLRKELNRKLGVDYGTIGEGKPFCGFCGNWHHDDYVGLRECRETVLQQRDEALRQVEELKAKLASTEPGDYLTPEEEVAQDAYWETLAGIRR